MQIKPVITTLSFCFISACSSPPSLTQPSGDFVPANPETPSYIKKTVNADVKNKTLLNSKPEVKPISNGLLSKNLVANKVPASKVNTPLVTKPVEINKRPVELKGFVSPVATPPLSTAKPINKNPFTQQSNFKPAAPVNIKPVVIALPPKKWVVNPGVSLKEVFMKWAAEDKCDAVKDWKVLWNTQTNYQIDSPLTFSGSFEEVTGQLFDLYRNANTPLYADGYKSQCLIVISDKK